VRHRLLVKRLVEDLQELKARGEPEPVLLEEVSERVKRLLLMKHNWLRGSMCKLSADGSTGIYQLHEEPDHSLAVFVVTWPPGEETRPHEHRPGPWSAGSMAGRRSISGSASTTDRSRATRARPRALGAHRLQHDRHAALECHPQRAQRFGRSRP
jgi:hypothetical protein